MARNDFLPIATGSNAFVLSQEAYEAHPHRVAGQQSGVASAELNNKALRQGASMASAIGQFIAAAGYDARDDGDIQTLQEHFAAAVAALISPSIAIAVAAAKKNVLETVFPVGSFYVSASSATSPATLLGFGRWTPVGGRFLFASNSTHPAGQSGGEEAHRLSLNEMPSHNHFAKTQEAGRHRHTGTVAPSGYHSHGGTTSATGEHRHAENTLMRRNAEGQNWDWGAEPNEGYNHRHYTSPAGNHAHTLNINNAGTHSHTLNIADNGVHTHTVTVQNAGGNALHNNMPPYLSVYMWRRTA